MLVPHKISEYMRRLDKDFTVKSQYEMFVLCKLEIESPGDGIAIHQKKQFKYNLKGNEIHNNLIIMLN